MDIRPFGLEIRGHGMVRNFRGEVDGPLHIRGIAFQERDVERQQIIIGGCGINEIGTVRAVHDLGYQMVLSLDLLLCYKQVVVLFVVVGYLEKANVKRRPLAFPFLEFVFKLGNVIEMDIFNDIDAFVL